jgi:Dolichyl-phosphate-mannose-protein mannosyltransferase
MTKPPVGAKTSAWVTGILLVAAAVAVVFGCSLAVRSQDTEPLESPLMLSVARQLVRGPRELYGPFGRLNHLVIIHAPLYYRLAALLAWPLYRAGLDPITAALAVGRSLSLLGLAWTIALAYRLARVGGAPPRVGWWAALLIAACPAVGISPYTVRPDMLGVALQTTGVFLVLSALRSDRPGRTILAVAFAMFGLAFCVKQQLVAAPATSALLVITAWLRGRVTSNHIACALLTCAAIVLLVYGTEELVTQGEMSQSVFRAAFAVSRVHPADSVRASLVLCAIFGRSTGLIAMLLAAAVASVGTLRGTVRPAVVFAGSVVLGLIALGAFVSALRIVVSRWDPVLTFACLTVAVAIVVPASCLSPTRLLLAERIDRWLWIYLAAEVGLVTGLSWMSTGAWVNYGIQAVVFASIVVARVLGRAFEQAHSPRQLLPIALGAVVVLIGVSGDCATTVRRRHYEQAAIDRVFELLGHPPTNQFFFAARPGHNRVYGRIDLVYDDWLYPVFESIHQAEPRSSWLRRAVASDSIGFVVTTSDSPEIDGVGETLPRLGYVSDFKIGPFYLWKHLRFSGAGRTR